MNRVKAQEDQIAELEAEASRLLRALDQAKDGKAEAERAEKRRAEEAARELASVNAEIENLRARAKQFSDYDEIKRELEIMKVGVDCVFANISTSSFPTWTWTVRMMATRTCSCLTPTLMLPTSN